MEKPPVYYVHESRDLVPFIFQTIGRASRSWTEDGVFDEQNAIVCAQAIIDFIRDGDLPEWYQKEQDREERMKEEDRSAT